MHFLRTVLLAACLVGGGTPGLLPATAQPADDVASHPGYVDLNDVESWFQTKASIQVDITGSLLQLVAQTTEESDSEFSRMVSGLKAIQVRGYPMQNIDPDEITRRTEELAANLEDRGWRRVLYVRDGSEVARIFLRPEPDHGTDRIAGLTVLAVDPTDETVIVNVVGPMEPDQIQKLGANFNVESLREVRTAQ